jgi:hypothetical protein
MSLLDFIRNKVGWLWALLQRWFIKLFLLTQGDNKKLGKGGEEANKLKTNIASKGENSYYYAHKTNTSTEASIVTHAPPKLISSGSSSSTTAAVPFKPFDSFAWSDSEKSVSVYIKFPDAGMCNDSDFVCFCFCFFLLNEGSIAGKFMNEKGFIT